MFRNYLKSSLRFFVNNKSFSLLNIAGLSIGTLCCIYILVYVREQYSYDRYFKDAGSIYRVTSRLSAGDSSAHLQATTQPTLAPALEADFPDLLISTQIAPTIGSEEHLIWYQNMSVYEKEAYTVDSNFFHIFNFHFTAGDADHAFRPGGIILLKPLADKIFGKEDPLGKRVQVENSFGEGWYVISGVVDESAGKSSIHANLFFAQSPLDYGQAFLNGNGTHWLDRYFAYTFVKLKPGGSAKELEKKLRASLNKRPGEQLQLQPISDIHTNGDVDLEMSQTVSSFFLAILIGIAVLIQLVACINFMNLATARASKRAKEVGVRKITEGTEGYEQGEAWRSSFDEVPAPTIKVLFSNSWWNRVCFQRLPYSSRCPC